MTPAQVAAALGITMTEARELLDAIERESRRLAVRRGTLLSHKDRSTVHTSLRIALRLLVDGLP